MDKKHSGFTIAIVFTLIILLSGISYYLYKKGEQSKDNQHPQIVAQGLEQESNKIIDRKDESLENLISTPQTSKVEKDAGYKDEKIKSIMGMMKEEASRYATTHNYSVWKNGVAVKPGTISGAELSTSNCSFVVKTANVDITNLPGHNFLQSEGFKKFCNEISPMVIASPLDETAWCVTKKLSGGGSWCIDSDGYSGIVSNCAIGHVFCTGSNLSDIEKYKESNNLEQMLDATSKDKRLISAMHEMKSFALSHKISKNNGINFDGINNTSCVDCKIIMNSINGLDPKATLRLSNDNTQWCLVSTLSNESKFCVDWSGYAGIPLSTGCKDKNYSCN